MIEHFGVDPDRVAVPHGSRGRGGRRAGRRRRPGGADRYLLAVGTVEPRKDLPTLVAAFDDLAARHPDLRLVIAGADGWGAEALTAAVAGARHRHRVVRLGWVDDAGRPPSCGRPPCSPTRPYGRGSPVEAMAAGTRWWPPAGSARGVPGRRRPRPAGDAAALAGALDRVLATPTTRPWWPGAGPWPPATTGTRRPTGSPR